MLIVDGSLLPRRCVALLAFSGALGGSDDEAKAIKAASLEGMFVHLGCGNQDAHIPFSRLQLSAACLREKGAEVDCHVWPGDAHKVMPRGASALRQRLAVCRKVTRASGIKYLNGLGAHLTSEAKAGAVPVDQRVPFDAPYGLYPEMINGAAFVAPRKLNVKAWFYRIAPSVSTHSEFRESSEPTKFLGRFGQLKRTPEIMRWKPLDVPEEPTDFVQGISTLGGTGEPMTRAGMAMHCFACNEGMGDKAFYNSDGDFLIVPNLGTLLITTEYGRMEVAQGEICVIQRGQKFTVDLPEGPARGWIMEVFNTHFQLPERGLIGSNGLADERHFQVPTAW